MSGKNICVADMSKALMVCWRDWVEMKEVIIFLETNGVGIGLIFV